MAFDTYALNALLKEHGVDITLRKQAESTYNNDTGTVTTTPTDYTVRAYFYDFKAEEINSSSILNGDRKVVVKATLANGSNTPKPDATDQVISNGDTLDIVRVFEVKSNNKVMYYSLQVRD
jgi:sulfur carrier protein ThiS